MEEQKNNAKCPFCGEELFLSQSKGTGLCVHCNKQFDNEKAIKLYDSIHNNEEEEEEKTAHYGEEYLEVERILQRAEYYFDHKDWENAKKEIDDASKITNTDYRIYMGYVRVETKNFTDYHNQSHKEYLNKAIELADQDEKAVILRLYKNYYQLSKLPDSDLAQYQKEENVAIKAHLEEKFKEEIPFYIKKEKNLKVNAAMFPVLLIVGALGIFLGLWLRITFPVLLGACAMFASYFFIRNFIVGKKQVKIFNAVLDFYDAFDKFDLSEKDKRSVLDEMKNCRQNFGEKNNYNNQDESVSHLVKIILETYNQDAVSFVRKHEVLSKYASCYEEVDDEEENS